jgi:hypothetical protein
MHCLSQPFRFAWVEWPHTFVEVDVAVGAGPRAARPHDQEGGGTAGEALADVWAAGLLAYRVELQVHEQVGHGADPFTLWRFHAQPVGFEQSGSEGRTFGHALKPTLEMGRIQWLVEALSVLQRPANTGWVIP